MELINPRTFLVIATLLGMLCALVLWVQARSFPDDIEGLRDWAMGVLLIGLAAGLASLRNMLPDVVTIIAASGMLLLGQFLLVIGLQRYSGRTVHWRPTLDAIGGMLIVITWLTFGSHSYQGRIFIMALAHVGFFSFGAYLAWQARPAGFSNRFLCVVFLLGAAVAIWRVWTLPIAIDQPDELFDYNLVQQVYLGMFSLGVFGLSIGFILLANERLRVELEFMATRNPMTHTFNRRAFFSRGAIEWARSQRSGRPLAVITSDIDFFKKVNDTHGHHVGDLVIKDYAHRAAQMLRLPDILARFGGEEFVILLPETDIEALISEADAALYRAKPGGRNRVEA